MKKAQIFAVFVLLASLTQGCQGESSMQGNVVPKEGEAPTLPPREEVKDDNKGEEPEPSVDPLQAPPLTTLPHEMLPDVETTIAGRRSQRLSVDQLRRSLPMLLGRSWADSRGRDYLDIYANSLGEADFQTINHDIREPSSLFAKTMDDMAGKVCREAVLADSTAAEAERNLVRFPEDIDRNLRWLKLKFHGLYVPEGCDEGISALRTLYTEVETACATGEDPDKACPRSWSNAYKELSPGWMAVCAALITDPEFMAY